ncbi:MAG: energy transducer TonB [Prevotella sp.]|nr:energy transducer TonB [Prevotella sp.]
MIDLASTRATTTTGSQTADSLFVDDEQPASFPGGQEALLAFLDQSVRYPEGYESCAQGRVVVRFTIDVDGSIVDPKVIRSLDPPLDKEALRVVGLMPKWIPAKEKGKNKRTEYVLPILIKTK